MSIIDGNYNVAPRGLREMNANEFANSLPPWSVVSTEFRQMYTDAEGNKLPRMISGTLHMFGDQTGFLVERYYTHGIYELKYYRFGCQHVYHELSSEESHAKGIRHLSACHHVYECSECGYILEVDSSG